MNKPIRRPQIHPSKPSFDIDLEHYIPSGASPASKTCARTTEHPVPADPDEPSSPRPDLSRHERKCHVCCSPHREAIEEEFLHWLNPIQIAVNYNVPDSRSIYRHAHATGLFSKRQRNVRSALEYIISKAESAKVTADSVVHAVKAYCRINDSGHWVEPPTHVIVSSGSAIANASPGDDSPSKSTSNRLQPRLETEATH